MSAAVSNFSQTIKNRCSDTRRSRATTLLHLSTPQGAAAAVLRRVGPYLVGRSGGQDELAVGVEAQAVDLGRVGVHRVAGLGGVV